MSDDTEILSYIHGYLLGVSGILYSVADQLNYQSMTVLANQITNIAKDMEKTCKYISYPELTENTTNEPKS